MLQFFANLARANFDEEAFRNFKFVALVLAEPVLKDLKIDEDHKLEGEFFTFATEKFANVLKKMPQDHKLNNLATSMIEGTNFMKDILSFNSVMTSYWDSKLKDLHAKLLKLLIHDKKEVFLPAGWVKDRSGHAVGISLKKHETEDTFDLRVFNTGEGANNHESVADPAGIYTSFASLHSTPRK